MIKNYFTLIILLSAAAESVRCAQVQVSVIGGPCQGCELVFFNMPERLKPQSRIVPIGEKGEVLVLNGIVYDIKGKPASGIIIYAYQTDAQGKYPKSDTNHGKLRGWAISDEKGRYQFNTVRPGAYPGRETHQHIHLHVIEPGKGTYYIDDITFTDDPLLTQQTRMKKSCRGGCGVTIPKRNIQGVWQVKRDIFLGKNITGY